MKSLAAGWIVDEEAACGVKRELEEADGEARE